MTKKFHLGCTVIYFEQRMNGLFVNKREWKVSGFWIEHNDADDIVWRTTHNRMVLEDTFSQIKCVYSLLVYRMDQFLLTFCMIVSKKTLCASQKKNK
jgi:hypothetical protein